MRGKKEHSLPSQIRALIWTQAVPNMTWKLIIWKPFPIWYKRMWKGERAAECQGVNWSVDIRSRCEICRHRRKNRVKVLLCTDVNHCYLKSLTLTRKTGNHPVKICPHENAASLWLQLKKQLADQLKTKTDCFSHLTVSQKGGISIYPCLII